ncbi:hypothetical protein B296_00000798 [Ensete ventricosum]|uniref:Uncharacterized protein n=1 Tax=Ensete ventricosum TaxID=4639 RepID=A0A426ZWS2_ENSVE|nr:hypothetical protein B296_00000798 [Ensete ventricosum]
MVALREGLSKKLRCRSSCHRMCSERGATCFCTALCSAPRSGPRCYHDGVLHRLNIYPLAVFRDLEATNLVVLEEEDDAACIGVGAEAVNELEMKGDLIFLRKLSSALAFVREKFLPCMGYHMVAL